MMANILLVTKRLFMIKLLLHYVLSWSSLLKVTSLKKIKLISKLEQNTKNNKFGKHWFKWLGDLNLYMIKRFYTEIWNVQMFLLHQMVRINLVILMYLKYLKKSLLALKLVLRIMPVLKYGRTNLMELKVIFGLWVAFCMKCVLWSHLLQQLTYKDFIEKFVQVFLKEFLFVILMICQMW